MEEFFSRRTASGDETVFDLNCPGYAEQLEGVLQTSSATNDFIDLGCGNGRLYTYLQSITRISTYVGYDRCLKAGAHISPNAELICADIRVLRRVPPERRPASLVAVNIFCYVEHLCSIPVLTMPADHVAFCYGIEPYPGIFWDKTFGRISPVYRTPAALAAQMNELGWDLTKLEIFYAVSVAGIHLLPVSFGFAFRRRD